MLSSLEVQKYTASIEREGTKPVQYMCVSELKRAMNHQSSLARDR